MEAKSYSTAVYFIGLGYKVKAAVIDPLTDKPRFVFPDVPDRELEQYRLTIGHLNALEHVARAAAKAGA